MMNGEYYSAQAVAAGSTTELRGNRVAGFLASVAGTVTITDADGTVLVDSLPVAEGFNRIPILFHTSAGGTFALTTAAGTILV